MAGAGGGALPALLLSSGGGCDVRGGHLADLQGRRVAPFCVDLCADQTLEVGAKPHHHATRLRPCLLLFYAVVPGRTNAFPRAATPCLELI